MNTNDIEQAIIRVISDASKRLTENQNHSNADWTDSIFTALTKYAYDLNLRVWTKKNEADSTLSGWLYDFMICEGQTANDIDKVWVALESEWRLKFDEIKYDFCKLVQSRSMLRVMIFQSRDVEKTISDLVNILEKSQMSVYGDRYLFAGWNDENGFTFKSHTKLLKSAPANHRGPSPLHRSGFTTPTLRATVAVTAVAEVGRWNSR